MPDKKITLGEVARALGLGEPAGAQRLISGVAALEDAGPGDLSLLSSEKFLPQFASTRAEFVLVQKGISLPQNHPATALAVDNAEEAIVAVLELFAPAAAHPPVGVDSAARVAPSAQLGPQVAVGPGAFVGERARIGARSILYPGVFVGNDVTIGEDCVLYANVVIRQRITIGNRVVIHACSVLGTDGFGYRWDGRQHKKVPQIGTVVIEDDVEIGSCVCIDRAKFATTLVEKGTKIDNLVQIAHNVKIGPNCIIVGQAGLAGSVTLGAGAILGGQAAIRDHVTIGPAARVAACAAVADDVAQGSTVSGIPALPHRQSLREQAALRRLPQLVTQVRQLQEEIEQLKKNRQA